VGKLVTPPHATCMVGLQCWKITKMLGLINMAILQNFSSFLQDGTQIQEPILFRLLELQTGSQKCRLRGGQEEVDLGSTA